MEYISNRLVILAYRPKIDTPASRFPPVATILLTFASLFTSYSSCSNKTFATPPFNRSTNVVLLTLAAVYALSSQN